MDSKEKYSFHLPVLLNEILTYLQVKPGKWYVDATAGGGGYTKGIHQKGGHVISIDQDKEAIQRLEEKFAPEIHDKELIVTQGNFRHIRSLVKETGQEEIQGVVFDLGMSNFHIRGSGRGFSFLRDEPLDMRMDSESALTAEHIVNKYSFGDIYDIFRKFGEEDLARQLAHAIVVARAVKPITTSAELATLVSGVYQKHGRRTMHHPATLVFQALRIVVNDELGALRESLDQAFELLNKNGTLVVVSFHSLEDRIVKLFFQQKEKEGRANILTKKPVRAGNEELDLNSMSRSAKLRAIIKI